MYIKTPRARVWVSSDSDEPFLTTHQRRLERPPAKTIEARQAFDGKLGRYIAIRLIPPAAPGDKEVLLVAVANKSPHEKGPSWVRAETALTSREVAQWLGKGF